MNRLQAETRFTVLLFTDIVGSTELKNRHGMPAYTAALRLHNEGFERLAGKSRGIRILQNMGDGYFAEADSVAEAVRFSLLFQEAMRQAPWTEITLTTRIGIHAGEVAAFEATGGSGMVSPAADLAARVMGLAVGGQILLTRLPFDEARHFLNDHPTTENGRTLSLQWLAHGPYLLKGRDEPIEIFEVGAEGLSPFTPPPDGEKAKRAVRPGEEETLGWRPAVSLEIPGRPGWHLTERLGSGGFGEVWTGEHGKLHERRAFKFCFDDERLRALKREVTLVRLLRSALGDRDDIVRYYELKLDEPPFYLESELAPQGNLLQWAEKRGGLANIPLQQRLTIVAHAATALAAAHSIGVLHKDIKPTNILIFEGTDGEPRPRLVDFGIGTLADPAVLAQHGVTAAGFTRSTIKHSTGTPTYSPPEYQAGKPYTVQGDIYGLGVLLYQLIVADGNRPVASGWERDITDPLLREDIAECVDGDPARRLASASELTQRLTRLDERRAEIVEKNRIAREAAANAEAQAAAIAARARIARLRRLAAAFGFLALLAMAAGLLAWANQRKATRAFATIAEQNHALEERKAEVDRKNVEYRAMLSEAARSDRHSAEENLQLGRQPIAFAYLARAIKYEPQSSLAAEKAVAALNTWNHALPSTILSGHLHDITAAEFAPSGRLAVTASADFTAKVWERATGKLLYTLKGHTNMVTDAQFSPDGKQIITMSNDRTARIWDANTGEAVATLRGLWDRFGRVVRFSPDSTLVVTGARGESLKLWEAANGRLIAELDQYTSGDVRFSPDGNRIVKASSETVREWEALTGKLLHALDGENLNLNNIVLSPDCRFFFAVSPDKTAAIWNASNRTTVAKLDDDVGSVTSANFSPDGTRIVTVSEKKGISVWNATSGKMLAALVGHQGYIYSARFSPDGNLIATAAADKTARVWDANTGKLTAIYAGHQRGLHDARFSADGVFLVTASDDSARVWTVSVLKPLTTVAEHPDWLSCARFAPDGTRFVTAGEDHFGRVWDTKTGKIMLTLEGHEEGVLDAQFSPDGSRIITASRDKTSRVWDAKTGQTLFKLKLEGDLPEFTEATEVTRAQFNSDGKRALTFWGGRTVSVWDATSGTKVATLVGHSSRIYKPQFNPQGTRIVTASADKTARVWDANTGETLVTLAGHTDEVNSAQFSPDGKRIVTASTDRTARVWDANTGKLLATLKHETPLISAGFDPTGLRILTARYVGDGIIWDATTGKQLVVIGGPDHIVRFPLFYPDGSRVVTGLLDSTARVWDATSGEMVAALTGHSRGISSVQLGPNGERFLTASDDKTARLWTLLSPNAGSPPDWFPDFLHYMAQARLKADGELEIISATDWLALREHLREVLRAKASQDSPYLQILRKFLS